MSSREQILRSAGTLFLDKGCKSVTMEEIANVNGVSKRTLYELFQDKAELLQECILLQHKDNMQKSEEVLAKADNVLEWFMDLLSCRDERYMSFYYNFFREVKKYYPGVFLNVVKDVNRWYCDRLELVIRQGQCEGLFISGILDARRLSLQLFELSVSVADRAVRNYLEIKHDSGSDCLMLFLLRGIATDKGREYIDNYLDNNKSLLK